MHRPMRRLLSVLALLPLAACAAGAPASSAGSAAGSDAVWQALLRPRPTPRPGAPRVAIGQIVLGEERPWAIEAPIPAAVGLQELLAAGLLRREDVQFIERRRFADAAERERRGVARPAGAPPVGTSAGAELVLTGTMSPVLGDSAYLDLRLVEAATSGYRAAWRVGVPRGGDPAALARRIAGSMVAVLDSLRALPAWSDPLASAAPRRWSASGVPLPAVESFFRGIAAEDVFDWEGARRAYQRAKDLGGAGFFEADAALARVARLRAGGTLGGS
jgi:hypothetical protein